MCHLDYFICVTETYVSAFSDISVFKSGIYCAVCLKDLPFLFIRQHKLWNNAQ